MTHDFSWIVVIGGKVEEHHVGGTTSTDNNLTEEINSDVDSSSEVMVDSPTVKKKYRTRYLAKWDYTGDPEYRQLSFKAGDIIELVERIDGSEFWVGEFNGVEGMFPIPYCELVKRNIKLKLQAVTPAIVKLQQKLGNRIAKKNNQN